MRRAGRTLWHSVLLGVLVIGAGYAVFSALHFLAMIAGYVFGYLPKAELTLERVAVGVLMTALWGIVMGAGLTALGRLWWRSRRLIRWVGTVGVVPSRRLAVAVDRVDIGCPVVEIDDPASYAFTFGVWRPRVVVSSGLAAAAGAEELRAVLHHEGHHVVHRDPLRVLVFRTWAAAFSVVPLVGAILHSMLDRRELAADRAAVDRCGVSPVAGALLKAVGEPGRNPGAALAALTGPDLLEARVVQLETGCAPGFVPIVSRKTLVHSMSGIAVIVGCSGIAYWVCLGLAGCCLS